MNTRAFRLAAVARPGAACALLIAVSVFGCSRRAATPGTPPVVAGLAPAGLQARVRGLVLLDELGCVACHQNDEARAVAGPLGPDLATVGGRVRGEYVAQFLADPSGTEPGTTMPDLLSDLDGDAKVAAAASLAAYVRSFTSASMVPEPIDGEAAERGRVLFHEVGCVACHAPRDEAFAEVPLPGSVPLAPLAAKYTLSTLRTFLLKPQEARPSQRMPDLHLALQEAHDLSHYLLRGATAAASVAPSGSLLPSGPLLPPDAAQVAAGRTLFAERGCGQCHSLPDAARAPTPRPKHLAALDPARGCLSGDVGPWPHYTLSPAQHTDIVAALAARGAATSDAQRIQQLLASRNCTACHERDTLPGIARERQPFFVSSDQSIGQDGRLPPPLTGVGAKLQHGWLADAIAHGQSVRPYLRTRMPGFGTAFATELADLLARHDQLPPLVVAALPADEKLAREVTNLGRTLVGDKGMNCIACHVFAGEKHGAMAAIDLVDSTAQRLRPEWFAHFLLDPFRFRPGTVMPRFFFDGKSTRPELGDGDVARQVDAMWHYLAEGRNVGKPSGTRHAAIELVVGDEAVLLRRSAQHTGKRGISIGLPLGVNASFDAERLAMNQIWWGRFVDAAGVWTGQGSGEARLLSKERVSLPNGPAFAVLAERTSPWPEATRRELGQRFLGYDLDPQQRPTFRYTCADVAITDAPVELASDNKNPNGSEPPPKPRLRRTFTFTAAVATTLHLRAARDVRIDDLGEGLVQVGTSLRLRLPPTAFHIRAVGAERELLVEIVVPASGATLTIDYQWHEAAK